MLALDSCIERVITKLGNINLFLSLDFEKRIIVYFAPDKLKF